MNSTVILSFLLAFFARNRVDGNTGLKTLVNLESLCDTKHSLELTHRSQIHSLVEQLDTPELAAFCSAHVRLALVELDQLMTQGQEAGDLCTLEEVEKIKEYNEKYIVSSINDELPKGLHNFILAYGLKVSNLCKKNMINSLMFDGHELLKADDFQAINPFTDDSSPIGQLMNEPSDYDDLLLPRDLNRVLMDGDGDGAESGSGGESDNDGDDKIFLQTATGHLIERLQTICQRRFKPLYEHLILPLIYLSNLGFNYQGEDLEKEMKEMSVNKEIHQWYRIVYLCESMQGIEIVEDPEDKLKTEGTDKRLVRILSSEEAAKIKAKLVSSSDEQSATKFEDIEEVKYVPEFGNLLPDRVIDLEDKSFMKLINSFATHKSELDRIRAKLMRKLAAFLFDKLKRGQFKMISSLMGGAGGVGGGSKSKSPEGGDDNEQIVQVLDDYVSQMTSGGEMAVAGGSGKRVKVGSGVSGLAKRYYHTVAAEGFSGMTGKVARKTIDKTKIGRYFWYAVAVSLFICGIVFLIG